eukprot:GFUD01025081.1.p1 GENE.GFUD01025081.1~~GFUD01025081.1.p1  ORF type:complete len:565 (+),score=137.16 GFUD01025081.1:64-1758(+)
MRIHTVDILSVTILMIITTTGIAEDTIDRVRVKEGVFREAIEINDEDTYISDSDTEEVCERLSANPNHCPCLSTNTSIICCNLDSHSPLPPGLCDSYHCSATQITLLNCHLHSTVLSKQFILSTGICQSSLRTLRLRNCSLSDTTFGQGLEGLRVLDLRGNQVAAIMEPQIAGLESIYLSGNNWPCIDPNKEKRLRSKSNLNFGEQMSWLLDDYWQERWIDQKLTFCNLDVQLHIAANEVVQKHSVESFLQFTKKTSSTCPDLCDCEVAEETIKFNLEDMTGYKVNVVCTDLGLTSLPLRLPPDTIYLDMANNKILSLDLMASLNPDYKNIERLILTNNSLKSLQGLENSWLQRNGPVLLDVRDNFIEQLDTSALEPMLSKASINRESNYFFAGNPWSCNCQTIKTIQEFLEKYSSLIMDTEHMHCSERECSVLHLDYKEMCTKDHDHMIWVIMVEAILLVVIMLKLTWDCVRYRRTGHLPWVARHLCWSVPGLSRSRWTPQLPVICAQLEHVSSSEGGLEPNIEVAKGSSGYITSSGRSSHSSKTTPLRTHPGGKESSVVRFL